MRVNSIPTQKIWPSLGHSFEPDPWATLMDCVNPIMLQGDIHKLRCQNFEYFDSQIPLVDKFIK